MTARTHQHGVSLTQDGVLLVVGTGPFGNADEAPSLTIRDMATGKEELVPLDRLHETVTTWADPRTGARSAVLAGGYTRNGAWDGLTVVDLDTHKLHEISIDGRPQTIVAWPAA
jgi:hypothetical protein